MGDGTWEPHRKPHPLLNDHPSKRQKKGNSGSSPGDGTWEPVKPHKNRHPLLNDHPSKRSSKRQKKANSGSSPVPPKTPSGSAGFPSSISSPSSSHQKNDERSKEDAGRQSRKRKINFDDEGEKQSIVSNTEHLKKLSEIIDTVEGSYPDLTGPVKLLDLFSPQSKGGPKRACRGVMLLKEGLSILTDAEHLSTVVDGSRAEE